MEQVFLEYEQHLQIFIDYGANDHARREVGEPIKPDGYDAWKAIQEKEVLQKEELPKKTEKLKTPLPEVEVKGYEFDAEGIPRYLTAHDVYMGFENAEWVKKHELKPAQNRKEQQNEQTQQDEEVYNRYSGLEKYLSEDDRKKGIINPEWIAEHGK
jgi:hypothetical protein